MRKKIDGWLKIDLVHVVWVIRVMIKIVVFRTTTSNFGKFSPLVASHWLLNMFGLGSKPSTP